MGLNDWMASLQNQDDDGTIFSPEPDPGIRVIPPEQNTIKVIPPEELLVEQEEIKTKNPPKKLRLNIKRKDIDVDNNENNVSTTEKSVDNSPINSTKQPSEKEPILKKPQNISQPKTIDQTKQNDQLVIKQQQIVERQSSTQQVDEITSLFLASGTETSKKSLWIEYYQKAKSSRKQNIIVEKMREGRFMITFDNKVLILPDYDVVNKDPDDILKDHWL